MRKNQIKINGDILEKPWTAAWIYSPEGPSCDFGVFHFRKRFFLKKIPETFILHISADNRYRLFINGTPLSFGPCRGDMNRWFFETVDIAQSLHSGENIIAAVVWNFGLLRPLAQVTFQTAFIVQGDTEKERIVDTRSGRGWGSFYNRGYYPYLAGGYTAHLAVGPGEKIDGNLYPWGWEKEDFDDTGWSDVCERLPRALPRNEHSWGSVSYMVPRGIPFMEECPQSFSVVVREEGIRVPREFLSGNAILSIPEKSEVSIILDQSFLTTAYPEIEVSGGKGSSITVCYAESLHKDGDKGNRGKTEGKEISGLSDCFLPDGESNRVFSPLWWRTFRYVSLQIVTDAQPLIIKRFVSSYTGYPFEENAIFESDNPELKDIWNLCWHTARLCAHETYMDCPYYEQLQYVGDTRIQALISLYVSGDDRLIRNAIRQFADSLLPDGLTRSQYPSFYIQVIPPFSLIWINMLNDYLYFRDNPLFIKKFLPAARDILRWFEKKIDEKTGLLGSLSWWNFVDWAAEYQNGVPQGAEEGGSSVISLLFINSLQALASIEEGIGSLWYAKRYKKLATEMKRAVIKHCWDEDRGLCADTPIKNIFSQHANLLAVLTDTLPLDKSREVMEKVLNNKDLVQCTYYFQFYLHQAVSKVGMGDRYLSLLEPWRKMLSMGLTTCAEKPEPTRSDCHAWSAHPNINLLAIVCGITSVEPGFRSVRIAPNLGILNKVEGRMPHPCGEIQVKIQKDSKESLLADVILPEGINGLFLYGKTSVALKPGRQIIHVNG